MAQVSLTKNEAAIIFSVLDRLPAGDMSTLTTLRACMKLCDNIQEVIKDYQEKFNDLVFKRQELIKDVGYSSQEDLRRKIEEKFKNEIDELEKLEKEIVELEISDNAVAFMKDNYGIFLKLMPPFASKEAMLNIADKIGL